MKKTIIVFIISMSIFSMYGQINVSASITKGTIDSNEFIYTTITNNSPNLLLEIFDGGMFEPEFNSIAEYSHFTADFTGYSNPSTQICQRKNYPLSLPYGGQKLIIKIMPGNSYTTFTRLYTVGSQRGIFDYAYSTKIKYLIAQINLMYINVAKSEVKMFVQRTNGINF